MKLVILIFLFINIALAKDLSPIFSLNTIGLVTDIFYANNKLYASSDNGEVTIFDIKTKEILKKITIPKIKDFMGENISSKIYSIDLLDNKILIVSQGEGGFRDVFIYNEIEDKLNLIISFENKYFIKKAKFIKKDTIFLGLLSNELISFDLKSKKEIYRLKINLSSFSDFTLNEDRSKSISSDESGVISLVDTDKGNVLEVFKGQNVDNIYQVDFKNSVIIGAGQDRRVCIYNKNKAYYLEADFLIYSVGLSPSGKLGAFVKNENNNLVVFDTESKTLLYTLKGQKASLTKILFINEDEIFTSSEDNIINFWSLK